MNKNQKNRNLKQTKLPLPPELIVHISKYLNIQDKFKLRLINKTFKLVFDELITLDRLTLFEYQNEFDYQENWFYTNRFNTEIDFIQLDLISLGLDNLNDLFKKNFFSFIKKLNFVLYEEINLNKTINQLRYLEELNLKFRAKSDSILSLPKLRILSIKQKYGDKIKIELETPSLSILRCENLINYHFKYPEKIIYLDTQLMDDDTVNKIEIFKNLEYLILYFKFMDIKPTLITKLNHLKELHFNDRGEYKLKEIYKYKSNNLKLFLYGIDYENLKKLSKDLPTNKLDLIFENYSKTIDTLSFIKDMNFDKLNRFLNLNQNITLDDIMNKFPNIKEIKAYELNEENIDCFFKFLSKCNNLTILDLKLLVDDQIYYLEKLPNLCKTIAYLYLPDLNVYEIGDLDFVGEFGYLWDLTIGETKDLHIIEELSNHFYGFISFDYIHRERIFGVCYADGHFLYSDRELSLEELIKQMDYLIDNGIDDY